MAGSHGMLLYTIGDRPVHALFQLVIAPVQLVHLILVSLPSLVQFLQKMIIGSDKRSIKGWEKEVIQG